MTRLDQPANVNVTIFIIWTLINFEIIDPSISTALIFDFRIDEVYVERAREIQRQMSLQPQIYTIGFESYNPVLNLGGLYVIISLIIVQMTFIVLF